MSCCRIALILFALLGVALIIVAAVVGFKVVPDIIDDKLEENTILDSNGTKQYDRFVKLPVAINFTLYYFHTTNPVEVMRGAKPIVKEMKHITYLKHPLKKNIVFNDKRKTILYEQLKAHKFSPDYSDISEDEEMTIINTPLVGIMQIFENIGIKYLNNILVRGYPAAFHMPKDTVFHKVSVGMYSLQGYRFCKLADIANDHDAQFLCAAIRLVSQPSLIILPNKEIEFSFFKFKDNTSDGVYEVEQGVKDIRKLANTVTWRGKNRTDFWNDNGTCNKIVGTDALIYPPFSDKDTVQYSFNTDTCQTVKLDFSEETEYEGIPGYRYIYRKERVNTSLPENLCYCIKKTRNLKGKKECLPSGFTDLYTCLKAPIILSMPHFLWGDADIAGTIQGLSPIEDKHMIYVDLEPNTGTSMRAHKRIQFNMVLRNFNIGLPILAKLKSSMIPLLWLDENVELPKNLQDELKDEYLTPVNALNITRWVLIAVGIVMFIAFSGWFVYKRRS